MKNNKPNNKSGNTPKEYDRWGKIGVKVISKPTPKKEK